MSYMRTMKREKLRNIMSHMGVDHVNKRLHTFWKRRKK